MGNLWGGIDCDVSASFPFPLLWPFVIGGGVEGRLGAEIENGRVRRRSAREYWCVMKYVWVSQKASFGSSTR
jgi:hypothetical protein